MLQNKTSLINQKAIFMPQEKHDEVSVVNILIGCYAIFIYSDTKLILNRELLILEISISKKLW